MAKQIVEETQDTSTQQQPEAPVSEKPAEQQAAPEIDLDRAKVDDDYLAEANARLRDALAAKESEPEKPEAKEKQEEQKNDDKKPETATDDPVVETILYRGKPVEVRKSQVKDLLQKGRHLEVRLGELSPVLRALEQNPELAMAVREGRLSEWVVQKKSERDALQRQAAQEAGDDELPEVEGYDKDDVKAVAKIVKALTGSNKKAPKSEQAAEPQAESERVRESRAFHRALAATDEEYADNMKAVRMVVAEAERTLTPAQFKDFFERHNDPTRINPDTGQPYFSKLYNDVSAHRRKRVAAAQQAKPAPVQPVAAAPQRVQSARIAPGASASASAAAVRPAANDVWSKPQDEFDREINKVLYG